MKTKAQINWEIYKEQEDKFKHHMQNRELPPLQDIDELFKAIRATEYRRGKEDGVSMAREEFLEREKRMQCLICGKSLFREIMNRKIRIHLCVSCREKELRQEIESSEVGK